MAKDGAVGHTLVQTHSCLRNGGRVIIRASVVKNERRGDVVGLVAHDEKCKGA